MTDQDWSDRRQGKLRQSYTKHVLGGESKQTNYTEWSGPR